MAPPRQGRTPGAAPSRRRPGIPPHLQRIETSNHPDRAAATDDVRRRFRDLQRGNSTIQREARKRLAPVRVERRHGAGEPMIAGLTNERGMAAAIPNRAQSSTCKRLKLRREIERAGQRRSCVLQPRPRVDEHCVPAGRLHNRHAERDKPFADIGVGAGAIGEIMLLVDDFAQALCDRFEIAARRAATGRKALSLDEPGAGAFGERFVR